MLSAKLFRCSQTNESINVKKKLGSLYDMSNA